MVKDILNVAVIGAGGIGLQHIEDFRRHPSARVVAVAEVSPERGREAVERFGIATLVTDYRELLTRADIDVVSIALPNFLHASVSLDWLRAGKNVLLDKPMATRAADAALLVAEAEKQGVLFMVGQNHRFTPEVQTAKQLIEQGLIGDAYFARTVWRRRSGIPRIGSWFTQKQFAGGGATYDLGVHALDRCLYLLGDFDAATVSGQTFAKFGPRGQGDGTWGKSEIDPAKPFDVDDLAVALIRLKSGRAVLLETSWAAHQAVLEENNTELLGTEGGLHVPPLRLYRKTQYGYSDEQAALLPPRVSPNRMAHFIDCLLGLAEPFVKPAESLAVQRILDAIYLSAQTGREVALG
jgi:predicted dehydrogenase